VFVRGLGGSNRSFAKEGMVEATWQRDIDFDMVAPNSHFAYYSERTLIERLRQDVILPAKEKGYKNIWLVGPSMGGLGSLLYIQEHPEDIDGIYLMSPFLGYAGIINEIKAQGGLQLWQPGNYSPDKDWQRMLWHWIKTEVAEQNTPPIYLGFGNEDTYVEAQKLLATVLPADHTTSMKGGHDYATFRALWKIFLDWDINLTN
jgi:pimeloyl-ACP methyl ester carboxylesterase